MIVGISEAQEQIINQILEPYFKEFSFFYYGSRVKGGFEATSDLDILIKAKTNPKQTKIPSAILEEIKEKFDQSNLPFIVNFSDYASVDDGFYEMIKGDSERVDWQEKRIGELAKITSSKRIFLKDYVKSGVPFWRSKEVIEQFKGKTISTELFITKSRYDEIKSKFGVPECGDILLTSVGTIGVPYLVKEKDYFYFKDGNLTWIKDLQTNLIEPRYLFLWLSSAIGKQKINGYLIGSSQQALTIDSLKQIPILLPPLLTQQKIAAILSSYDDLIENNNRRIKILEEMAQEIYKEWFVNFKFPNYRNTKFVDSELGKIPEGWKVVPASAVVDIAIGRTPPRKEPEWFSNEMADNIAWLSIRDLGSNSIFTNTTSEYLTKKAVSKHNVPIVKKNTIVVSFKLTVGKVAIATADICTNEAIAQFPIKKSAYLTNYFLYSYLTDFKYPSLGNTSSIGNAINSTILKNMPVMIPPKNLVEKYTEFTTPIFESIQSFLSQNQNLRQTRDLLLPRLISGELSVENLEVKI